MVAAFYSNWTAATWGAVLGPGIPVLLAIVAGAVRGRRLRKPVVIRRAKTSGHLLDYQFWPRAPAIGDSGSWQLARAVFQVNNRSDSDQSVLINGPPRARVIWLRRRRGLYLCPGRMVIPPQSGGWVGPCVVVSDGHQIKDRDRLLVRVGGRLGQSGKMIGYLGFARLYKYLIVDGADFRGGNSGPAKP